MRSEQGLEMLPVFKGVNKKGLSTAEHLGY